MVEERLLSGSIDYVELLFHWHRYLLAANLAGGKTVLDIACGDGYGANHLAQFAEEVVAVDLDAKVIEEAKKKYVRDNLTFLPGSAVEIPCPDSCYDLVVSYETIEHLDEKSQKKFLLEIRRVLKQGGIFLISTPDKHRTDKFQDKNPYHLKELYLEDFVSFLKDQFKFVKLHCQEVNLASFIWPFGEYGRDNSISEWKLKFDEAGIAPTNQDIKEHLYMVAVCSDSEGILLSKASGVCHDVSRKPAEAMWARGALFEKKCTELKRESTELTENLIAAQQQNRSLASQCEVLQSEYHHLEESNYSLIRQNKILAEALIDSKKKQEEIINSRSWKVVLKYRRMMDQTLFGNLLKPLRSFFFCCLRRKKS